MEILSTKKELNLFGSDWIGVSDGKMIELWLFVSLLKNEKRLLELFVLEILSLIYFFFSSLMTLIVLFF